MNVLEGRNAYVRTIAQLVGERAAAKPLIESVRMSGKDLWDVDIPVEWRNAGFVQELTAAASDILESDPRNSLSFAQLALAIAAGIPSGSYPEPVQAHLEGNAWKEIGTAHRYMSQFDASLRAYDAAQRAFESANALGLEEAVVDFARAIVLWDLNRCDEALDLLNKVGPVFESFADQKRLVQVKTLRGNICTRQHRWSDARAIFADALDEVPSNDLHTRALLYENLGVACTELGLMNEGVLKLHTARQLFSELGIPIEVNRCEWNIACVLLKTNEFPKALKMLGRVREFFLQKGLPEEAGLVGLDAADAAIALGENDRARELVSQILAEFTEAKLNARALTALAYLRDILPETLKPANAVRHVRQYLGRLQSEPALLFLPLPE